MKSLAVAALPVALLLAGCGARGDLPFDPASSFGEQGAGAGTSGNGTSGVGAGTSGNGTSGAGAGTSGNGTSGAGAGTSGNGTSGAGAGTSGNTTSGTGPSSGTATSANATAATGGKICPDFGDMCTTCLATTCPDTWCNCYENQACIDLFGCSGNCNGNEACNQQCLTQFKDGTSDALLVSDCAGSLCNMICGWGEPIDPCTKCELEQCDDEFNACLAEPECSALYYCLAGCGQFDLACQQGCYDDHGSGVPTLQDLLMCADDECVQMGGPCGG